MARINLSDKDSEFIRNALLNLEILIKNYEHDIADVKVFVENYSPQEYVQKLQEMRFNLSGHLPMIRPNKK